MTSRKKILLIIIPCIFLGAIAFTAYFLRNSNEKNYKLANSYVESGKYSEAQKIYSKLGQYKDSEELSKEAYKNSQNKELYNEAIDEFKVGNYQSAIDILKSISDFEDSETQIEKITYILAKKYYDNEQLNEARKLFLQIEEYKDSLSYLKEIELKIASNTVADAYKDAKEYYNKRLYKKALEIFRELKDYKDSLKMVTLCEENINRQRLSHTIACGVNYSIGIKSNGKVETAGDASDGQCNVENWDDIVSIDGYGIYTIGLKQDGTVNVAGNLKKEQKTSISTWTHIVDVAAGERYVVALKNNGEVVAEGHNGDGQCKVEDWKNVIDIDTGWSFTVGLTEKGDLLFAGLASKIEKDYISHKEEWKDVVKIAASGGDPNNKSRGTGHVVGLKADGTVVAVGDNTKNQCQVNEEEWKNIIAIAAGDWYTVALRKDGKVLITGENEPGTQYIDKEIYEWTQSQDIAAGYGQTLGITKDGNIVGIGLDDFHKRDDAKKWTDMKIPFFSSE